MQTYKLLAALLDYPSDALLADLRTDLQTVGNATALIAGIDSERLFTADERCSIAAYIDWLVAQEVTDLQSKYVQTFDLTPEYSLHLTHHIFGDDKNRGPALIDLTEYYKTYGFQLADERELPDYLPLVLEFASMLEQDETRVFLADAAKVFNVLAANLEKADSPWAPLIRVIESQGSLTRLAA